MRTIPIVGVFLATSMLVPLSTQHSQAQQQTPKAPEQGSPKQTEPKPQPVQPSMPSDDKLVMMIRSTLIALNQANATGNYTVLREMGAPGFQEANSPARLTESFAELRHRNLDLSPILLFQPKLFRRPEINAHGFLRVTGFFPTAPEQVNFDLIFQPVQETWRLFGVAVKMIQVQPDAAASVGPQAAPANAEPATASKPSTPARKAPGATAPEGGDTEPEVDIRDRIENDPSPP